MNKTEESSPSKTRDIYNIVQTWWHIEDTFSPNPFHHFRQIKDIYLSKDFFDNSIEKNISINLPENIFSIRVYCRNPNQEFAFVVIDEKNSISMQVHLPNVSQFPIVTNKDGTLSYHIKLEIEYALSQGKDSVGIEFRSKELRRDKEKVIEARKRIGYILMHLSNIIRPRVNCSSEVKGWLFPEFNITFPRGWEIESHDIFSRRLKSKTSHILLKIYINKQNNPLLSGDKSNVVEEILKLSPPDVDLINGKRKYVYILSPEGQEKYRQLQKNNCTCDPIMTLRYAAELSTMGVIFSFWLPLIFLGLSIAILLASVFKVCNSVIIMSFMMAYLVFLYTNLSYKKDGYDFPSGKLIVCMIFSIVFIIISAVIQVVNS